MKIAITKTKILFACMISVMAMNPAAASVASFTKNADGITCILDKGAMKIKICRSDIVEIQYSILVPFPSRRSLVVADSWKGTAEFSVSENPEAVVVSTSSLQIEISKRTDAITYREPTGAVILAEDRADGKRMMPDTVAGIHTYACSTRFLSPMDEALYGLGCHPKDSLSMNYKGRDQDLAIKYMTGAIPVLLSTRGYGLMWDNYSASKFYGAEEGDSKFEYVSESGVMVDYYFFYGPEFDHIIASYRATTGEAPMFPKWAFGLFQSQDRYQSQKEVLAVKDHYRNDHIPVDCIVQDWFYWEPNVIGSHVMAPTRYPDPKAMVDELHQANIHAMISIWPVFAKGTQNFDELKKAGGMTEITWDNVMTHTFDNYYDAHDSSARDIYWREAKDSLIGRDEWDAWWVDQCEPDNGDLLDARRQAMFSIGKGIDYFNTFSLAHTTGLYKNWRHDIPGKRAFFLVRQAFAGQQRNSATLWSSDITCTFHDYKDQVPQAINACVSGIPYWTSDIGGYHLGWMSPDWSAAANRELFTRWFQFGSFCPVFRIHGKGERALFSNNWDAETKKILLKYDNLRYRLLPYIYSLSWKVTSEGYTPMRSLAFDFRGDRAVDNIQDQYMFGPAFLVSPVTEPMRPDVSTVFSGQTRKVYLPEAALWVDFWTGRSYSGKETIDAPAPIETLPLYVRAGSIIPMGPYMEYATEKKADQIELRIYPGANGKFVMYEDANDGYEYEKGEYATIEFTWNDAARMLTIEGQKGSYPGMLAKRSFDVVLVQPDHGTGVEISQHIDKHVDYNGTRLDVKL